MNIITAAINSFGKSFTCPLYQWDYGQILMITGITLPDAYEVNFAQGSETCTVIGTADGVEIPDEYLQNASDIIAYLYLHTGETDGETVYELTIPVIARPEPSHEEPTPIQQSEITQLVAALNTAVGEAEGYAQDAQEAAESIPEHILVYDEQSLTESQKTQARTNIGAISESDVPTKVSELTNDSGYVTQWTAPVRSVNGQTGAVNLHSVLYDQQSLTGRQKAQARSNIDVPSMDDFDAVADNAYEALGKADWAVSYNPVQSLTDQEKADARANIDAVSSSDINAAILASLITDTASGDPCAIPDGASAPVVDCTVQIVPKQSGSGTPSPSNVRPISGWTEMTMRRTGINIWDEEWEVGTISGGVPTTSSNAIRSKNFCPCLGGKTYYGKCGTYTNDYYLRIWWYDAQYEYISGNWIAHTTATVPDNAVYYKISTNTSTYVYGNVYKNDICINVSNASVNGTYEPFNGQTYTQSWTPTVYGGTLDLTTGVLTVDKNIVIVDGITKKINNVGVSGATGNYYSAFSLSGTEAGNANLVCNEFANNGSSRADIGNIYQMSNGNVVFVQTDQTLTTKEQVDAWLVSNPLQLVYKLAEPTTIQLTPTQVDTILGSNTFSADTGSVEIEYRADTELWVEGHVPSKTSQLTNDSGFITASTAPVRSVNGKTGVVTIANATTTTAGLMSATDKANLDTLMDDYTSAMTALGV